MRLTENNVIAIADLNTVYKHIIPAMLDHLGVDKQTVIDIVIKTDSIVVRKYVLDDGGAHAVAVDGKGYLVEVLTYPRAGE